QPTQVFLNGAGASFPALLYQRWFQEFNRQHPHIQIDFQPIGSGAGIQQVIAETVDFGASDIAMTDEDIAKVDRGVLVLPMTAGSVAIVFNLPGIESGLKLSREVYPKLFLGDITRWNDPAIASLNPDLDLPDLPIALVHRSDGSGTTAVFTSHLSAINPDWRDRVGSALNVQWPAGVGIKSNAGVSAQVQQAEGALGYVEYSYAQQLGLSVAALENQAGEYVLPDIDSAAQGLNAIALPDDLRAFIPDPEGEGAYPIVTYSWLLAYRTYDDPAEAEALRQVLQWALAEGQAISPELGYVPLAPDAIDAVTAAVAQIGT
ncbi:MAG: phosphate ABC transporter substrate-binding protein PstS, partial [Cyanobacteria bacterium J06648_11]